MIDTAQYRDRVDADAGLLNGRSEVELQRDGRASMVRSKPVRTGSGASVMRVVLLCFVTIVSPPWQAKSQMQVPAPTQAVA